MARNTEGQLICYDERSSDYSTVQLNHYETHSCVERKFKVRGPGP